MLELMGSVEESVYLENPQPCEGANACKLQQNWGRDFPHLLILPREYKMLFVCLFFYLKLLGVLKSGLIS